MTRWFEDIVIDEVVELGTHTFTDEEIVRFGKLYDPQYYHVDPKLAAHSHFGGLIASGWHTVCVGQRKMVDTLIAEEERLRKLGKAPGVSGPSPGVNAMVFEVPVRGGDTVHYTLAVTSKRPSNSIPGWGLLFNRLEARNQRNELVYHAELVAFSKLRDYRMPLKLRAMLALSKVPVVGKAIRAST